MKDGSYWCKLFSKKDQYPLFCVMRSITYQMLRPESLTRKKNGRGVILVLRGYQKSA